MSSAPRDDDSSVANSTSTSSIPLTDDQIPSLLSVLRRYLPHSLPLYRRLQFHLLHPNPPHAEAFVATAAGSKLDFAGWLEQQQQRRQQDQSPLQPPQLPQPPPPWLAAHIDLSNSGQTQIWIFASWEPLFSPTLSTTPSTIPCLPQPIDAKSLLHTLFTHLLHSPRHIPSLPPTETPIWRLLRETGKYTSGAYSPTKVLIGTLHEELCELIRRDVGSGNISRSSRSGDIEGGGEGGSTSISRQDRNYLKYTFKFFVEVGTIKYLFKNRHRHRHHHPQSRPRADSSGGAVANGSLVPSRHEPQAQSQSQSQSQSDPHEAGDDDDNKEEKEEDNNEGLLPLPPGYTFSPLTESHLQTVLDRSPVPRTIETLRSLPSVGIFFSPPEDSFPHHHQQQRDSNSRSSPQEAVMETTMPIAWGFLGKDASLSSLHTEPGHRGRGLAVLLARKLLAVQAGTFFDGEGSVSDEEGRWTGQDLGGRGDVEIEREREWIWAHADVSEDNVGSRRVMEKIGGKVGWTVTWVEVDLAGFGR